MTAWQLDVINGEQAVPTVVGTKQRTRMSPRTCKSQTGLITLHPSVVVFVSVTLQSRDQ